MNLEYAIRYFEEKYFKSIRNTCKVFWIKYSKYIIPSTTQVWAWGIVWTIFYNRIYDTINKLTTILYTERVVKVVARARE